jgi:hypothetical protein
MGVTSKTEYGKITTSGKSIRTLLREELHKASIRLEMTPFPFCELDCPWLPVCRKIRTSECISAFLIEATSSYQGDYGDESDFQISWH